MDGGLMKSMGYMMGRENGNAPYINLDRIIQQNFLKKGHGTFYPEWCTQTYAPGIIKKTNTKITQDLD